MDEGDNSDSHDQSCVFQRILKLKIIRDLYSLNVQFCKNLALTWLIPSVLVPISSAIPSNNDNATGILGLQNWGWGSN